MSPQQKQRAMMDCVAAAEGRVHPPQGKVAHQTSLNPAARFSDTVQYDRTALGTELTDYLGQAKPIFRGSDSGPRKWRVNHPKQAPRSSQAIKPPTWPVIHLGSMYNYKELHN